MSRVIFKKLEDPVYKRNIYLGIGDQEKVLKQFARDTKLKNEPLDVVPSRLGMVWQAPNGAILIWLHKFSSAAEDIDTMVHEIFHLVHSVMDCIGGRLTDSSEESYAYLAGYYASQISELYKKYK
jgi:hypothetical protein